MSELLTTVKQLEEIYNELQRRVDYSARYFDDPVGFIYDILGEKISPDLQKVCESVVQYPITRARSGNGTGKSYIESRLAVWFYKCRIEPQVICAASPPLSNLESILWGEIETVYNKFPFLFTDSGKKHLQISRSPLQFIKGVTIPSQGTDKNKEAAFSGKHPKSLLFLFDEGDNIPDPVYDGAETCMSGGFSRMLISYNPRARVGKVYRMYKDGVGNEVVLSAFNHPSVIDDIDYNPGTVNRARVLNRVATMTRPIAPNETVDKQCFKLPDFLVGCVPLDDKDQPVTPLVSGWYRIIEHRFSHVVPGEYPAQADNQLISEEWIDKARSRYDMFVAKHGVIVPEHIRCTCGVDIADQGKDSSVLTKRFGNFVHPQLVWNKKDVIEVGDLVKADLQKNGIINLSAIYCDGTGVGAGTAPYLAKAYSLPAVKIMVANKPTEKSELGEFGNINDQLMWQVREWLRTDLAMLPPCPLLIEELLAFNYEVKNGKVKVSTTEEVTDLLKRSPDRARSLSFSFMKSGLFADRDLS